MSGTLPLMSKFRVVLSLAWLFAAYCPVLPCTALLCIALHCIALQCIALHGNDCAAAACCLYCREAGEVVVPRKDFSFYD